MKVAEKVKMMPWQCQWGFHKWSVWGEPFAVELTHVEHGGSHKEFFQKCRCAYCEMEQVRKVWGTLD